MMHSGEKLPVVLTGFPVILPEGHLVLFRNDLKLEAGSLLLSCGNRTEMADITALLHTCLLEVYGVDVSVEYLADAFYHTKVLRGLFPTKNPLKRGFFWLVEPLFGGRGFITGHISPRKLAPDMPDAWTDPFTGTEHTGGVFALLPKAERRSEEFMGAALLLWLDKYTEAEFAEKIGSMSYTEGCVTPASDPANEKETTT